MKTRCSLFVRNKISVFAYKTLCPSSTQQHHTFRVSITEIRLTIRKTAARSLCIFFLFFFSSSFLFFNINLFDEKNPQNSQKFLFHQTFDKKKKKKLAVELLQTTLREIQTARLISCRLFIRDRVSSIALPRFSRFVDTSRDGVVSFSRSSE